MDRGFISVIIVVIGLVSLMIFGIYCIEKKQCYKRYSDFQPEYVGVITGCMVKYNGKTVPVETVRLINE